jgi:hypothetical protein
MGREEMRGKFNSQIWLSLPNDKGGPPRDAALPVVSGMSTLLSVGPEIP